jgi:hypothetical protein
MDTEYPLCAGYLDSSPPLENRQRYIVADREYRRGAAQGLQSEQRQAEESIFRVVSCVRADPLAVDLTGLGAVGIHSQALTRLDLFGNGQELTVDGLPANAGWLVLDRNGNGIIDSGEIFGNVYRPGVGTPSDGFADLRLLDMNGDGVMDGLDPAFNELGVWLSAPVQVRGGWGVVSFRSLGLGSIRLDGNDPLVQDVLVRYFK